MSRLLQATSLTSSSTARSRAVSAWGRAHLLAGLGPKEGDPARAATSRPSRLSRDERLRSRGARRAASAGLGRAPRDLDARAQATDEVALREQGLHPPRPRARPGVSRSVRLGRGCRSRPRARGPKGSTMTRMLRAGATSDPCRVMAKARASASALPTKTKNSTLESRSALRIVSSRATRSGTWQPAVEPADQRPLAPPASASSDSGPFSSAMPVRGPPSHWFSTGGCPGAIRSPRTRDGT